MPAHRARHRPSTPPVDAADSLLDAPTDQWIPVRRDRALRTLTAVSCGLAAGTVVATAGITAVIADAPAPAATTVEIDPAAAAAQLAAPEPADDGDDAAEPTTRSRPVPVLTPPPAAPRAASKGTEKAAKTESPQAPQSTATAEQDSSSADEDADTRSSGS